MRILFICHGNICRSPMAEYIMKELVKREGVASDWEIESAAVSREEIERRLWNGEVGGTACGVYISYLRKKLAPLAGDGAVVSVRKKGYMLCPPALGE